ncbi:hypothetical protein SRABI96_05188 [Peribacillus sp. Bi96]|uniref:hypothetical protein n=1 Tax=Peribacillus sp. Bi96 TaxID=2884273 RepID=UPI001D504807|nr:hypothetical protein [Peribacillus sp. Bi96]CAH0315323.1 hypothetical protein SRABI96_05188 [Peribacillus sp. Bi96]
MEKTSYRYVINAVGKGGQTYLTQCQDKNALKKWIADNEDKLIMNELRITDKKKNPLLKFFF